MHAHITDCIVFASRILYLTVRDINVLHADLLAVVGGGRAREGQQQHVDGTNVAVTSSGGNSGLLIVPHLITEEVKEKSEAGRRQGDVG